MIESPDERNDPPDVRANRRVSQTQTEDQEQLTNTTADTNTKGEMRE